MMVAGEKTIFGPTSWLYYAAVDEKIHVSAVLNLSLNERVGVVDVHEFSIGPVQFVVVVHRYKSGQSRIQACDPRD